MKSRKDKILRDMTKDKALEKRVSKLEFKLKNAEQGIILLKAKVKRGSK